MKSGPERVADSFEKLGIKSEIVCFEQSARTAIAAAKAVGCELSQIAKTIVFKTSDQLPVLVVASGANRIDKALISDAYGAKLKISSPEFAKQTTGFNIGEVTPFGLVSEMPVLVDESLFRFNRIWISSGSENSLARIKPDDLLKLPMARKVSVTK